MEKVTIEVTLKDGQAKKYEADGDCPYGITAISYTFREKETGDEIHLFPISVAMIRIINPNKKEKERRIRTETP